MALGGGRGPGTGDRALGRGMGPWDQAQGSGEAAQSVLMVLDQLTHQLGPPAPGTSWGLMGPS